MSMPISMFSFFDELKQIQAGTGMGKIAKELTEASREKIKAKNFALTPAQSATGEAAYPIHDRRHAANALSRVEQHGTPKQKAEVYKDVAKKYPDLARKSDVPALRAKAASVADKAKSVGHKALEHGAHAVHGFLHNRMEPAQDIAHGLLLGDSKRVAHGAGGAASGALLFEAGRRAGKSKEKDGTMGMAPASASALPGMVGGPPGGMGMNMTPPMAMPGRMG